ncbi:ferredoxin, 2Fe-2S type, ISC system [Chromobacterium haemolyticum]|uniref:ISC system 2Fe-2S type ferredoxin n=1 Tax=Chromobacterium haemolyticum TaxID=394935 RepID=UPI000313092A|nr:ISC system 2Fe-2S type ferredoxin [Chromobacterium haemolyticum]MDH0343879.1 ISC system 2Fe-2S type ferredoxin [Chromobacterium haemolyticum]OQS39801.1 ferredoxin, 2Fe-2S type, ISC system [Chromobacterium haemolyticum]
MPRIIVLPHTDLCPEGVVIDNAEPGQNICQILLDHDIEIEHACEMSCACTTCHCIVREGGDSLNEADELEEDLLDKAWGLEAQSRLSCQAIVADEDLVIDIPRYTINHAREHH